MIVVVLQGFARAWSPGAEIGTELLVRISAWVSAFDNPKTVASIARRLRRIIELRLEVGELVVGLGCSTEQRIANPVFERDSGR